MTIFRPAIGVAAALTALAQPIGAQNREPTPKAVIEPILERGSHDHP